MGAASRPATDLLTQSDGHDLQLEYGDTEGKVIAYVVGRKQGQERNSCPPDSGFNNLNKLEK